MLNDKSNAFCAIVRRRDRVNRNVLKCDAAAGGKKANFVHLSGLQIPLGCSQCAPREVDRDIKFSLKDSHRFCVITVIMGNQKRIDFRNVAAMLGQSNLRLACADTGVEK